MPAKKLTSRFHTFLLLYYFLGEWCVVLSNSTKRLLTHLCILRSPCAAHSAQSPQSAHTAQPQPEQQRRRQQSPAALLHEGLQHGGQLPAQAEGKRRQSAGAEGAPIRRAGQVERPGQRREEHQPRQQLPDHRRRAHPVPAGAVLHKAGQHTPVEHGAAQHGGRQTAGGGLPVLPQPAQAEAGNPEGAQRLQRSPDEHSYAAPHPDDTQHTGQAIADGRRQCRDAGRRAVTPQRADLRLTAAARRYGGTDGHGQRSVPQPDRASDAQARFCVGEKGQVDAPENAHRHAQEKRNHNKKVHL